MEEKKVTIGDKTLDLPSPFVVFATQNPLEHEGTYPLPEAQLDRFLMRIILTYPSPEDEKRIFIQETSSHHSEKVNSSEMRREATLGCEGRIQVPETTKNGSFVPQDDGKKEILNPTDLLEMMTYIAKSVRVDTKIYEYVSAIISATRRLAGTEQNPPNPPGSSPGQTLSQGGTRLSNTLPLSYGASTRAGLALIRAGRVRAIMMGRDYMIPEDVKSLAHEILDHRVGLSYESASDGMTTYGVTEQILDNVRVP